MALKILFTILILMIIISVGVIIADSNRFVIRKITLTTDKISKNLSIVFLSDLHNKCYGKENETLLKAIEALGGDLIIAGGDMMTAKKKHEYDNAVSLLTRLSKTGKLFCGYGNHESRAKVNRKNRYGNIFEQYKKALEEAGITLLDNVCVETGEVVIQAFTMPEEYYYKKKMLKLDPAKIEELIGPANCEKYNILLAHNPEQFEAYEGYGSDLVLSGHLHGGVVRIPFYKGIISPRFKLFPKYDGGLFTKGKTSMIVSRGLGMHTIPLRMFNPAEIVYIQIKKS